MTTKNDMFNRNLGYTRHLNDPLVQPQGQSTNVNFGGGNGTTSIGPSPGYLTMCLISRDKLEPNKAPAVIPAPKQTLDQMVAQAQAIVRVTIEAQYEWDKLQIKRGFKEARVKLVRVPSYLSYLTSLWSNVNGLPGIPPNGGFLFTNEGENFLTKNYAWDKLARIHEKHHGL